MSVKMECDLCGRLVTEDKTQEDGSIEEWEAHADEVRPFTTSPCQTVCGVCHEAIRVTVCTLVTALERIRTPAENAARIDPALNVLPGALVE